MSSYNNNDTTPSAYQVEKIQIFRVFETFFVQIWLLFEFLVHYFLGFENLEILKFFEIQKIMIYIYRSSKA